MNTYYRMTAKLLSPLIIQQDRRNSSPQTLNYIPGGTLRGALAASYLREGKNAEDDAFRTLFLENPVRFCNLLPGKGPQDYSRILPATLISCKREPGFDQHGVFDTLAATAASRIGGTPPDKAIWKCPGPNCGEDMKPFSGFWNGNLDTPEAFEPDILVNRHTGIDRSTGTVANAMFFITQSIADFYKHSDQGQDLYSRQHLSGQLFLNEEQVNCLTPLLENTIFVGADRTRGFGEIKLTLAPVDDKRLPTGSAEAIQSWHNAFTEKLSKLMPLKPESTGQGIFFSVTLESHAVFVDRFLRPVLEIEEFRHPDIRPVTQITSTQTIRGWQAAMGLARNDDIGVSMGSVYLFKYTGDSPGKLQRFLEPLLINGVGLRKEQGFGQISICDALHTRERI